MRHTKPAPTLAIHHCRFSQGLKSLFLRLVGWYHATPTTRPRLVQRSGPLTCAWTSAPARLVCHYRPVRLRRPAVPHRAWALLPHVAYPAKPLLNPLRCSVVASGLPSNALPQPCTRFWLRYAPGHTLTIFLHV